MSRTYFGRGHSIGSRERQSARSYLQEVLTEHRTRTDHGAPGDLVFPTTAGRLDSDSNVRRRFLVVSPWPGETRREEGG